MAKNKEEFELSYSSEKVSSTLCVLVGGFILIATSGLLIEFFGMKQDDIKWFVVGLCVLIFIAIIAICILTSVTHSLIFDENGIRLKDGKITRQILYRNIKHISFEKNSFKYIEIETVDESNQSETLFIPIQFLLSSLEEDKEISKIEEYIAKYSPNQLVNKGDDDMMENKIISDHSAYILQRKSNLPLLLIFGIILGSFFFAFPLIESLIFAAIYGVLFALTLNYGKNDIVFDRSGITFYRKKEISHTTWDKLTTIYFENNKRSTSVKTLHIVYNDENDKSKKISWTIEGFFSVNADIYDYYVNVSKIRGKSAIDVFEEKK